MKSKIHYPTCDDYLACLQKGGGSPFYKGSVMQRGYEIGGLFKSLATTLLPLLPKIGKFVAKTALGVATDKLAGIPLSKAIRKRTSAAGKQMVIDAISKPVQRRRPIKRNKRGSPKTVKRIRTSDVFDTV